MIAVATQAGPAATDAVSWFEITKGLAIPVVVAIVPVIVGIILNARQRRTERDDRLRRVFSEALQAVADYQELPYLVRRRSSASPMTREELARHASDVQSRLDFYVARLELESPELGDAFDRLVGATRRESGAHMTEAWNAARISDDADVPLGVAYDRTAASEARRRCLSVMRSHLGVAAEHSIVSDVLSDTHG